MVTIKKKEKNRKKPKAELRRIGMSYSWIQGNVGRHTRRSIERQKPNNVTITIEINPHELIIPPEIAAVLSSCS